MDLPNLKELKAILKLCRSQGVTDISLGAMVIKFGDMPRDQAAEEVDAIPGAPSDEELLYWSTQPDPLAERTAQ